MKPQNFYVSCTLKTKEGKKKKTRGEAGLFEPYFANASFSPSLRQLVPSCNSPHIFMGRVINLCEQLPTVELLTRPRSLGKSRHYCNAHQMHSFPPWLQRFKRSFGHTCLLAPRRIPFFFHSPKTWMFWELALAMCWAAG